MLRLKIFPHICVHQRNYVTQKKMGEADYFNWKTLGMK